MKYGNTATISHLTFKRTLDGGETDPFDYCNQWNVEFVFDDYKDSVGTSITRDMSRKDVAVALMELATKLLQHEPIA